MDRLYHKAKARAISAAKRIAKNKLLTAAAILCGVDWGTTQTWFLMWYGKVPIANIGEANQIINFLVSHFGPFGVSLYAPIEFGLITGFTHTAARYGKPGKAAIFILLALMCLVVSGNLAAFFLSGPKAVLSS